MKTLSELLKPETFEFEDFVVRSAYLAANDLYFTCKQAADLLNVAELDLVQYLDQFQRHRVVLKIKPDEATTGFETELYPSMLILVAAVKFGCGEALISKFIGLLHKIRKIPRTKTFPAYMR